VTQKPARIGGRPEPAWIGGRPELEGKNLNRKNEKEPNVKTSFVVHIAACCSLVSGTLLLGTGNTLAQKDVRDWEILLGRDHRSQAIQPSVGYEMMNRTAQQVIKYGEQKHGINLVWDRSSGRSRRIALRQLCSCALVCCWVDQR
jgi:hypothetical protein